MSDHPRDPTQVKFAPCECDADEEDWELQDSDTTTDGDRGLDVVTYKCQECGKTHSTTTDVKVV